MHNAKLPVNMIYDVRYDQLSKLNFEVSQTQLKAKKKCSQKLYQAKPHYDIEKWYVAKKNPKSCSSNFLNHTSAPEPTRDRLMSGWALMTFIREDRPKWVISILTSIENYLCLEDILGKVAKR